MPLFIVFGRITAEQDECSKILKNFYFPDDMLACMEQADDGCSRTHCHFIARTDKYKSLKSLRQAFSDLCKKELQEALRYSIKEYDETKDCEAYICKGHKKDASIKPDIFINTYGIDVQECYDRYHETAAKIKQNKYTKAVWKEVIEFIDEEDPTFFKKEFRPSTQIRIASYLYDYYLSKERMIQGKYVQQMIIQTIIAQKYNSKTLKKNVIQEWCSELTYWDGMQDRYTDECIQAFDDL